MPLSLSLILINVIKAQKARASYHLMSLSWMTSRSLLSSSSSQTFGPRSTTTTDKVIVQQPVQVEIKSVFMRLLGWNECQRFFVITGT